MLKFEIRSMIFNIYLVSDEEYDLLYPGTYGVCTPDRRILFRASNLTPALVRHELLHAYVKTSLIGSMDVSPSDMEEAIAEIFEEFGPRMVRESNFIFKELKKAEKRNVKERKKSIS